MFDRFSPVKTAPRGLRAACLTVALCSLLSSRAAEAASSVFIDTPKNGEVVGRVFHIGGWAIDWAATDNTGVTLLHVWAYPTSGAPPVFLGQASGGARPDVAAAFGANFNNCGFGLIVNNKLAPGSYSIAVFPFSTLRNSFDFGSAVAFSVTVAASASSPAPAPAAPAADPDPAPAGAATLKVLQWNIHHGVGTDGQYSLTRFVDWIARLNPDIVSINEAERNTSWGHEDQPARFEALLEQKTGREWYAHFAQEFGDWGAAGKGNLILSRFPFAATGREVLSWDRTMAIATVVVNGRNLSVISTHLDPDSRPRREQQAREVIAIASSWGNPRLVAGDFNAWPDQSSIAVMAGAYSDTWAQAAAAGAASSFSGNSPFGATKKGRIDYIFTSGAAASGFALTRVQVPDTRDASGVMPSDHRPVLATFQVR